MRRNPLLLDANVAEETFGSRLQWRIALILDSAAIYVLHKDEYLPSAAAIRSGEGVNDNAKLHFQPGKTYKIRLINMSALASMFPNRFPSDENADV